LPAATTHATPPPVATKYNVPTPFVLKTFTKSDEELDYESPETTEITTTTYYSDYEYTTYPPTEQPTTTSQSCKIAHPENSENWKKNENFFKIEI